MGVMIGGCLKQIGAQLPGAAGGINREDPEKYSGKFKPENAGEPHERPPHGLAKPLAAARHSLGCPFRLSRGACHLFGRSSRRCRGTIACALSRSWRGRPLRRRVRRSRRIRSRNQRLGGRPCPCSQRAAKAYRIHGFECSRSAAPPQSSFHSDETQRQPAASKRKVGYRGGSHMKGFFWMTAGLCAAAVGVVVWSPRRTVPVQDLAHRLETAWSDHHTVV